MKIKKLIALYITGITISGLTLESINSSNADANSDAIHTEMTEFPKSMRGKWYTYDKYDGIIKTHVYKKKITWSTSKHKSKYSHGTNYLHKYADHEVGNTDSKKIKWIYIQDMFTTKKNHRDYQWLHTYGWEQSAGDGEYFSVHKLNGHKVLTIADGAGTWVDSHNYRSVKLAKQLYKKHYKGFYYQTNI